MPFGRIMGPRGRTSSTSGEEGSDSSGIFFITPLRGNRARMLTEETVFVQNGRMDAAEHAAEAMKELQIEDEEDESSQEVFKEGSFSTVSSLSVDSFRRFATVNARDEQVSTPTLPREISIPSIVAAVAVAPKRDTSSNSTSAKGRNSIPPPPPIWTSVNSPLLPRPRAPRHAAAAAAAAPTFLRKKSPLPRRPQFHVPPPIAESKQSRDEESSSSITLLSANTPSLAAASTVSGCALLGSRPKRIQHHRHHRVASGAYSVGSLVGQSSLVTAPTTTTSSSVSAASSSARTMVFLPTINHAKTATTSTAAVQQQQSPKRKPVLRDELKYMLGRVATPIRRLTHTQEPKPDLRRAKGCLT